MYTLLILSLFLFSSIHSAARQIVGGPACIRGEEKYNGTLLKGTASTDNQLTVRIFIDSPCGPCTAIQEGHLYTFYDGTLKPQACFWADKNGMYFKTLVHVQVPEVIVGNIMAFFSKNAQGAQCTYTPTGKFKDHISDLVLQTDLVPNPSSFKSQIVDRYLEITFTK